MSEEVAVPALKISVKPNGPLRVEGSVELIELVGSLGAPIDLTGKPAFSLCRCGLSAVKPFCDGAHKREGWSDGSAPAAS
jgi:CDGSH-type Zn-finger protein